MAHPNGPFWDDVRKQAEDILEALQELGSTIEIELEDNEGMTGKQILMAQRVSGTVDRAYEILEKRLEQIT